MHRVQTYFSWMLNVEAMLCSRSQDFAEKCEKKSHIVGCAQTMKIFQAFVVNCRRRLIQSCRTFDCALGTFIWISLDMIMKEQLWRTIKRNIRKTLIIAKASDVHFTWIIISSLSRKSKKKKSTSQSSSVTKKTSHLAHTKKSFQRRADEKHSHLCSLWDSGGRFEYKYPAGNGIVVYSWISDSSCNISWERKGDESRLNKSCCSVLKRD